MEQIYWGLMQTVQSMGERQTVSSAENGSEQETSFQELLKKQQTKEQDSDVQNSGSPAEQKPETAGDTEETEEIVPQEQLMEAALAAMQNPVIPAAEPVEPAVQEETAAVAAVQQEEPEQDVGHAAVQQEMSNAEQQPESVAEVQRPDASASAPAQEQFDSEVPEERQERTVETDRSGVREREQDFEVTENVQGGETETAVFQDVETVMVKVGETEGSDEMDLTASVTEQVHDQIANALEQDDSHVTIQLTPENLGTIEVQMSLTEDGSLTVTLHAQNHHTQQLLEKGVDGLQSLLARNVQQDVQVEVSRQEESQQQHFEDGQQNHQQQQENRQQKEQKQNGNDFLHQLRLGLIPLDAEEA